MFLVLVFLDLDKHTPDRKVQGTKFHHISEHKILRGQLHLNNQYLAQMNTKHQRKLTFKSIHPGLDTQFVASNRHLFRNERQIDESVERQAHTGLDS